MTDRELLELAAKAAGWRIHSWIEGYAQILYDRTDRDGVAGYLWNPLIADVDAFRLVVKLRIDLSMWIDTVHVTAKTHLGVNRGILLNGDKRPAINDTHREPYGDDPGAATRRAIVRAAAEIGKGMQ